MGEKQNAIELAQKAYKDASIGVIDNSDNSYTEATIILQLLRDNFGLWATHP